MPAQVKFAVILSGCGTYDGAEIHEATLTLYAISKAGHLYQCFAPDIPQFHVINHLTGEVSKETRNVLIESARIARGNIRPLSAYKASDFDALVFPGGYGVAKNLSDWAFKASEAVVLPEVSLALKETAKMGKPIGAMCISPVLLAKVFDHPEITLGNDEETEAAVQKTGAKHIKTRHGEVIVDLKNKLVTTPCYMLDASIADVGKGVENLIMELLKML